ncbi:MAG: SPOR domain-containing protein [Bacteroidaceae bacterium]|nr:SPOR domain-containing protein [Bacteroidaceae bacterium]
MKRLFFLGSALVMVLAMTSCKSSESAYKKAYEKAQAQQTQPVVGTTQQQTPVQVTPVTPQQQTPVTTTDYSNVSVRTEAVTLVSGAGLKAFSVVVGSFGLQSNAQSLQSTLAQKGYAAQIVSAVVNGMTMYRVVATTHDTKDQAAQSRAALMGTYPDAWLLYKK